METIISHTEIIDASIQDVWKHLLYKIDYPEHFVPNVSGVEILEKNAAATIRKMTVTMPTQAVTIIEKITAAPYLVKFEIIEHPTFTGYVDNLAEVIDEHSTRLTYTMCWLNKATNTTANNMDILKAAVQKSKQYIEHQVH
jgi:hypothetical protein